MIVWIISRVKFLFEQKMKRNYIDNLIANGLVLGKNVEIIDTFFFDPSHCYLISIGDNCTICPGVRLIAHDASTKKTLGYTKLGRIDINENCFIGDSTLVLPNVTIGPGSIVGAGSVVVKDVPPDVIAAGNPTRILGPVSEYLKKIESISSRKTIFNEEYLIGNLNDEKRKKILQSVDSSIGFIV